MRPCFRRALLSLILAAVAVEAACGYSLVGRGVFLPDYIHTVAIPTFANRTGRFEVEIRITDAVAREFVSRGNFRVVGDPEEADAVLRGEILGFDAQPVALVPGQGASTFQVIIQASVTFTDLVQNRVLFSNSSFLFRDEFELPGDPGAFFDVEIISIDEIAQEFARSVVSSILEGF